MPFIEAALRDLTDAGLSGDDAALAYSALWTLLVGDLVSVPTGRLGGDGPVTQRHAVLTNLDPAQAPTLVALLPALLGQDPGARFRELVDRVLTAFAGRAAAGTGEPERGPGAARRGPTAS
ncbi:MAG: hypothetical protein IRZ08_04170 [Frankia sp.]|nr:hypothetical protein [Frankia sp.]